MGSIAWKVIALLSGLIATKVSKKVTGTGYKAATGSQPPSVKHDPTVSSRNAAVYAILSTAIAAGIKVLAERKAADFYTKSAGHPPAAVAKQQDKAAKSA